MINTYLAFINSAFQKKQKVFSSHTVRYPQYLPSLWRFRGFNVYAFSFPKLNTNSQNATLNIFQWCLNALTITVEILNYDWTLVAMICSKRKICFSTVHCIFFMPSVIHYIMRLVRAGNPTAPSGVRNWDKGLLWWWLWFHVCYMKMTCTTGRGRDVSGHGAIWKQYFF